MCNVLLVVCLECSDVAFVFELTGVELVSLGGGRAGDGGEGDTKGEHGEGGECRE